jgi:peptide/nickel transport system substrate-binding protein
MLVGVVGAAALALSGCSSSGGSGSGDEVTIAINADPGELNPITNATEAGQILSSFAYESLVTFPADGDPQGAIADSWTESTTEVSFTLKDGVTCTDGTPMTASDVKASFEYAGAEETGSPFAGVYFPATGLTIDADDDARTVTFTSEEPQSFLLATIGQMPVACAAGVSDPTTFAAESQGTGPYKLSSSSPGQSYTFDLRDDYQWGPDGTTATTAGLPKKVTLQVVESESTAANLLQSGQVQVGTIAGPDRDRVDSAGYNSTDVPIRPGLLFVNQAPGRATNDPAVRQALVTALDRDAIGKVTTSGRGEPLKTLTSSFSNVCTTSDATSALHAYDADAAGAALDAAGWVKGADGIRAKDGIPLSLILLYPGSSDDSVVSGLELVQQELAAIGVTATPTPSAAYTDVIFQGGDWDMVWAPISTTLPSTWQGILSGAFPPDGGNWTYNTNQEFFDLADQAQAQAGEASCDGWQDAQAALIADADVTPFWEATETVYGNGVEFGLNSNGLIIPTSLRLSQ